MRTEIGEIPQLLFEIKTIGNEAQVIFWENAQEVVREQGVNWAVDEYRLKVKNRKGLQESIEANYQAWLDKAKAQEGIAIVPTVEERVTTIEDVVIAIAEILAYE